MGHIVQIFADCARLEIISDVVSEKARSGKIKSFNKEECNRIVFLKFTWLKWFIIVVNERDLT
jgi:hypothetical protein